MTYGMLQLHKHQGIKSLARNCSFKETWSPVASEKFQLTKLSETQKIWRKNVWDPWGSGISPWPNPPGPSQKPGPLPREIHVQRNYHSRSPQGSHPKRARLAQHGFQSEKCRNYVTMMVCHIVCASTSAWAWYFNIFHMIKRTKSADLSLCYFLLVSLTVSCLCLEVAWSPAQSSGQLQLRQSRPKEKHIRNVIASSCGEANSSGELQHMQTSKTLQKQSPVYWSITSEESRNGNPPTLPSSSRGRAAPGATFGVELCLRRPSSTCRLPPGTAPHLRCSCMS